MSTPAADLAARLSEAEAVADYNLKRVVELDAFCRGWMRRALEAEAELARIKERLN